MENASRVLSEGWVLSTSRYERHGVVVKKTLHRLKIETEAGVGNGNPPSRISSEGVPSSQITGKDNKHENPHCGGYNGGFRAQFVL